MMITCWIEATMLPEWKTNTAESARLNPWGIDVRERTAQLDAGTVLNY